MKEMQHDDDLVADRQVVQAAGPAPLPPQHLPPVTERALFDAVRHRDLDTFDRLAARWPDPLTELRSSADVWGGPGGDTLLHCAARSSCVAEMLRRIPGSDAPEFLNARGTTGTAASCAIFAKDRPSLEALIDAGAEMGGQGLLPFAIDMEFHEGGARLLDIPGIDLGERGGLHSQTAIQCATDGGHVDAVKRLFDVGGPAYRQAMIEHPHDKLLGRAATYAQNSGMVHFLLEEGIPPDQRNSEGRTPLHLAARCGHIEIAAILLARGADPNAINHFGVSVADDASYAGQSRSQMIRLLMKQGAVMPGRFQREMGDERPFNPVEMEALEAALSGLDADPRHTDQVARWRSAEAPSQDPQLRALVDVYMKGGRKEDRAARVEAALAGPAPVAVDAGAGAAPGVGAAGHFAWYLERPARKLPGAGAAQGAGPR
jgi:hypothetical protein